MRVLITNDDSVSAAQLLPLVRWWQKRAEVTVVVPEFEQSGKSHAIDFTRDVEVKRVPFVDGVTAYSMDSTPADCIRFGVLGLKQKYDLILSGVNKGVNLGADIVYSGTVGAVFEASRLDTPAIAFSAFPDGQEIAAKYFTEVYEYITKNNLFAETPLYNVNIPNEVKGIRMTY